MANVDYIPKVLREAQPYPGNREAWSVGIEIKANEYGMTHGPFWKEIEALDTIGERGGRIVHFYPSRRSRVEWWWHNFRWVKRTKKIIKT